MRAISSRFTTPAPLLLLGLLFMGLLSSPAIAYIPDYHMIMSRLAENNGRGTYEIEQEILFPADPEPLRVKETWIIGGEYDMSVTLSGVGPLKGLIQGRIVYDKGSKYFVADKKLMKAKLSSDWWQPFFHFRYSKNIKPLLVSLNIAPPESLQDRKITKVDQKTTYTPQDFLRLSRTGGVINYTIGTPSSPESSSAAPGLWIQQDMFLIRKLRLPSQVLVSADDYSRYSRHQWLPKKTTVEWDQNHAQILLSRVDALNSKDKRTQLLNPKSLSENNNPELQLPDQATIKEFYQRFR